MIRINLGCGRCFHPDWVNLDSAPGDPGVLPCDVRRPLPFADGSVDAIYSSHLLEHLTADEGAALLAECFRVLKPGGIIRVVVPDLEGIARAYLAALEEAATSGDRTLLDWTRMELYDQAARSTAGGAMAPWARKLDESQAASVRRRAGSELDAIRRPPARGGRNWRDLTAQRVWHKLRWKVSRALLRLLGGAKFQAALDEGAFRQSGEVHRTMYDRLSLASALANCGFGSPLVMAAHSSAIADFGRFELDVQRGAVRKPDSLFMEARRP